MKSINHPPCKVLMKQTLSLSLISASTVPSISQSASFIKTNIPGLLNKIKDF